MSFPTVLYGPESLPYEILTAATPAPGSFTDNTIAQRGKYRLGQQLILGSGKKFLFALAEDQIMQIQLLIKYLFFLFLYPLKAR